MIEATVTSPTIPIPPEPVFVVPGEIDRVQILRDPRRVVVRDDQ